MHFNKHSGLEGAHAFLSASKYHWVNYDDAKMANAYITWQAAQRGTELHEFAKRCIELKQKLPRTQKTLNMYVNDGIGYRMTPEQVLFYSENCFGTADTISFKSGKLRIHDLKTGVSRVSMMQLSIYAALFCLEYRMKPGEISYELRIYQTDDVQIYIPEVDEIAHIIDRIITFDKLISRLREEAA